jgi:hypothetical protein
MQIFVRQMSRLAKTDLDRFGPTGANLATRIENVACEALATGAVDAGSSLDAIRPARVTELIGMLDVAAFAASVALLLAVAANDLSSLHFCEVLA